MQSTFEEHVIRPFIEEYLAGRTPNPCIVCNETMKFGKLDEERRRLGCDVLVTGHYVRITCEDGVYHLKKAKDPKKDQSYMLYRLSQQTLSHVRFPLGEYTKAEVREMAMDAGFENASQAESQDICFVPEGDYSEVLRLFLNRPGEKSKYEALYPHATDSGDFVDRDGKVLGRHNGRICYTIGQRKGLGISATHPLYVLGMDAENNRVILGKNEDLFQSKLTASNVCWIAGEPPKAGARVQARIRYHGEDATATVVFAEGIGGKLALVFEKPQRAITPGQSVVLYDGDDVLGGGIISV